jgi:hypothetical protein
MSDQNPKRRWLPDWLRYGPRWGLFEKTNPNATPKSVFRWAMIGAIGGAILGLYSGYRNGNWLPIALIPLLAIGGAFIAGLVEYQLDDSDG